MLAVESEKRRERAEARKSKYAPHMSIASRDEPSHGGVRDVSSVPRLRKERGSQPQPSVEAGRAELLGNWLLSPTSTRYRASDFGVECQPALAADGTCTLTATCWDDERPGDPSDDGGATLRCDGRWSLREVGRPCNACPSHGEGCWSGFNGSTARRWAWLRMRCLSDGLSCPRVCFARSGPSRPPRVTKRRLLVLSNCWCASTAANGTLPSTGGRCGKSAALLRAFKRTWMAMVSFDLARRLLAEDIMDVDRGGVGHSLGPVGVFLRHQWRRLWWPLQPVLLQPVREVLGIFLFM